MRHCQGPTSTGVTNAPPVPFLPEDARPSRAPPRSQWCSEQELTLHESWDSLSAFDRSHRGRIADMEFQGDVLDEFLQQQQGSRHGLQPPPCADKPEPARGPDGCSTDTDDGSDFKIPVLPYGQHLVIDIKSTWGDRHYVGLNGIEIFSSKGEPVQIANIQADPPDINILPAYGKDPRVVTNLIDGVNRTQDDMHVWLAPFTPGRSHSVSIDFMTPCHVALIRIWNYNKSRIHSFRGAKDVEILLDAQCIFNGEIAKASGTLAGGTVSVECPRSPTATRGASEETPDPLAASDRGVSPLSQTWPTAHFAVWVCKGCPPLFIFLNHPPLPGLQREGPRRCLCEGQRDTLACLTLACCFHPYLDGPGDKNE